VSIRKGTGGEKEVPHSTTNKHSDTGKKKGGTKNWDNWDKSGDRSRGTNERGGLWGGGPSNRTAPKGSKGWRSKTGRVLEGEKTRSNRTKGNKGATGGVKAKRVVLKRPEGNYQRVEKKNYCREKNGGDGNSPGKDLTRGSRRERLPTTRKDLITRKM